MIEQLFNQTDVIACLVGIVVIIIAAIVARSVHKSYNKEQKDINWMDLLDDKIAKKDK